MTMARNVRWMLNFNYRGGNYGVIAEDGPEVITEDRIEVMPVLEHKEIVQELITASRDLRELAELSDENSDFNDRLFTRALETFRTAIKKAES